MTLIDLAKSTVRAAGKNAPALLTGAAVAAALGAVYTGVIAGAKAIRKIDEKQAYEQRYIHTKERIPLVWKEFILPVSLTVVTVGCTIAAQSVNARRQAVLVSGITLVERSFNEYRTATKEVVGDKKHRDILERASENRNRETITEGVQQSIVVSGDEVLCEESFTGRMFKSDYETIRKAANDTNLIARHDIGASANEFWTRIGMKSIPVGNEVGWNTDHPLDLRINTKLVNGKPVLNIEYDYPPFYNFASVF